MRKALRAFLGWLDRRFPEKVVITQAEYVAMKAKVDKMPPPEWFKQVDTELAKLNVASGFINRPGAPMGAFQR